MRINFNYFFYLLLVLFLTLTLKSQTIFFHESFDDSNIEGRGWYDQPEFNLDTTDFIGNSGSSAKFTFLQGAIKPQKGGGRIQFTPSEEVYLSYWVKYSTNYVGSQQRYHPHEFNFTTTEDHKYIGPAYTHLTTYIEHNNV